MRLFSIETLLSDYFEAKRFIQFRSKFSSSFKTGSIVFVSYGSLAVGPDQALFLRKKKIASRFMPNFYNSFTGIVVKKNSTSITIASNFRGFFFYKTFLKDSPNLISLKTKIKSYFKVKGSNIVPMIRPGTSLYRKLSRLR